MGEVITARFDDGHELDDREKTKVLDDMLSQVDREMNEDTNKDIDKVSDHKLDGGHDVIKMNGDTNNAMFNFTDIRTENTWSYSNLIKNNSKSDISISQNINTENEDWNDEIKIDGDHEETESESVNEVAEDVNSENEDGNYENKVDGDHEETKSESVNEVEIKNCCEMNVSHDKNKDSGSLYFGNEPNGLVKSNNGSVHSDDSEKENMSVDVPMDLSTKSSNSVQDVIMLSDEEINDEQGQHNSDGEDLSCHNSDKEYSLDDLMIKQKMIKRMQAELRNEEAKLFLLKKLRFSQMSHQVQDNVSKKTPNQVSSQPPPLMRGTPPQLQQVKPAHSHPPPLQRASGGSVKINNKAQGSPPLVMAPHMDQRQVFQNQMKMLQQRQQQQLKQLNSSTNAQASNIARFRGTQAQADALRQLQQVQQRVVEEMPAQRQTTAKLVLRKQLEKTLLQIPPPKPPPPEMNFIPSLTSPDFIYLLGLEEAVNFIIDTNLISKGRKNPDEKMVCNPFTCVQCSMDFTPVWKREKPGSKNVICEQCVMSNQRKALKQEHTNRLKSAFVKALQQEQEIERMQSQEVKITPMPVVSTKEKTEQHESLDSSARNAAAIAYKESMAETLRQHQSLLQAHQVAALQMGHPVGLQDFNPRTPFPYQLPFSARASDLQRQYLLDMIPKGGLPWNS